MKKFFALMMVLALLMFTGTSFGDQDYKITKSENSRKVSPERQAIEVQIKVLKEELKVLKKELYTLIGDHDSDDDDEDEDEDHDSDHSGDSDIKIELKSPRKSGSGDNKVKYDEDEDDDDDNENEEQSSSKSSLNLTPQQQARVVTLKAEIKVLEQKISALRKLWRISVRNDFTEDEKVILDDLKQEIEKKLSDIKVLAFDSVLLPGVTFKFDLPPVIKQGRTLVPVRALTEGLGAKVEWQSEKQMITITYEGKTIILKIDENVAIVNGVSVPLDAKAEIIHSRTVVPLRFIAELLGLKVDWHPEDETIELEKIVLDTLPPAPLPVPVPLPVPLPPVDSTSGATPK